MVQEEISFKDILYRAQVALFIAICSAICFVQFGRGRYEEHFCETILNLD